MSQNIARALNTASGAQKFAVDGLRTRLRDAMGLVGAEVGLEPFVSGDVLDSNAQMGHACVSCNGSFEKCFRNISKPACCSQCKSTATHGQRTIARMMEVGDVPQPIGNLLGMASAMAEIKFPTLKEQAAEALEDFAKVADVHSTVANRVADLLSQILESEK